jgi:hypothetical protein
MVYVTSNSWTNEGNFLATLAFRVSSVYNTFRLINRSVN